MNEDWLVILNPNAGGRSANLLWPQIEKELIKNNFKFFIRSTRKYREAIDIVKSYIEENEFRKILVIGGDGTLHEVINGIMLQKKIPLEEITVGMISTGTGNDWIKTHNISSDYTQAIKQIKEGKIIKHDVGRLDFVNDEGKDDFCYFINSIGIGFDAKVIKYMIPKRLKGNSKESDYMKGLLKALVTNKNEKGSLNIDGQKLDVGIFDLAIGNCRFKGGGFKMLPTAIPNDELLDITLANDLSKLQLIRCLPKLLGEKVEKINFFKTYRAKSIDIDIQNPICIEADGEFIGYHPTRVSIETKKINMISNFVNSSH